MARKARLYHCVDCHRAVIICTYCDRGNVYCKMGCAKATRTASLRLAGKRYQNTHRGKLKHAARQRRYRERTKKVTHQGSQPPPPPSDSSPEPALEFLGCHCHFCGQPVSDYLRSGFLRHGPQVKPSILNDFSLGP